MAGKESNGSLVIDFKRRHDSGGPNDSVHGSSLKPTGPDYWPPSWPPAQPDAGAPPAAGAQTGTKLQIAAPCSHAAASEQSGAQVLCLDPQTVVQKLVSIGAHKADLPLWNTFVQGVMAGCYIGFGGSLIYSVGLSPTLKSENLGVYKLLIGSFGLPFGLLAIVLTGASLFTSNTMYMPVAFYHGKCSARAWLATWFLSYFGNLAGCLLICGMMYGSNVFEGYEDLVVALPESKVHHLWHEAFVRAIVANWCVNLAIFQATAASDLTGKFVAIYLPISAFVAIGLEHSVANMFLIPMGMLLGADISMQRFIWHNLIPVTLGNIVAGWLVMATVYTLLYSDLSTLWVLHWRGAAQPAGADSVQTDRKARRKAIDRSTANTPPTRPTSGEQSKV